MRIEPHVRGEVFTLDRIEADGRAIISSTILYLDGTARDLDDFECLGTQSSRRLENETVEIRRVCTNCDWTLLIRESRQNSKELTLAITGKLHNGSSFEWRVALKKQ